MRRTSPYYHLRYIVECQPRGRAFFEPIAAFNSEHVASDYMHDCFKDKPSGWRYRLIERRSNEAKTLERLGDV